MPNIYNINIICIDIYTHLIYILYIHIFHNLWNTSLPCYNTKNKQQKSHPQLCHKPRKRLCRVNTSSLKPPRSPPSFATKMNGWLPLRISGGPALQAAVRSVERCSWSTYSTRESWEPTKTHRWCLRFTVDVWREGRWRVHLFVITSEWWSLRCYKIWHLNDKQLDGSTVEIEEIWVLLSQWIGGLVVEAGGLVG